jgi:hypothetical protein
MLDFYGEEMSPLFAPICALRLLSYIIIIIIRAFAFLDHNAKVYENISDVTRSKPRRINGCKL